MKRVLFVDDDRSILAGLRLLLTPYRRVWHMDFVASGEEALQAMAAEPYDVIVADMRMPGMDGAALLGEVRQRHPRTVRIVLSGDEDLEARLRSAAISHQYLTKPCRPSELRDVIERACNLERLLSEPDLQPALGDLGELPVLPWTYQALTAALADPDVNLDRVASIVEQDQAVTARILQLVNSSHFGVRRDVTSVRQATVHLGAQTIRDLVLSCSLFGLFDTGAGITGFSIAREQRHSFLTGRIARRLLPDKRAAGHAFLAGMLHDVGRLVLATRLTDRFLLERTAPLSSLTGHDLEARVLGVTHAEIGAYLLGLWGMPYQVIEAVAYHHNPATVEGRSAFGILAAVHVADALAHAAESGEASPRLVVDEAFLKPLGVWERLDDWRRIAREEAAGAQDAA